MCQQLLAPNLGIAISGMLGCCPRPALVGSALVNVTPKPNNPNVGVLLRGVFCGIVHLSVPPVKVSATQPDACNVAAAFLL